MSLPDVVLLSTADWDNQNWTNKQHVANSLADRGHRVLYIDSVGLRRPNANRRDLGRIVRRLARINQRPRKVQDNLWVWSPTLAPWHHIPAVRAINRLVFSVLIKLLSKRLNFESPWLWTYNPLTTLLINARLFSKIIYHCVDDISAQPGMPSQLIQLSERELVSVSDIVFTTSPKLQAKCEKLNPNTHYFSNVADFKHFSRALDPEIEIPSEILGLPRPRLGFIGAISAYKINFDLLKSIAKARPDWSLILVGDVGEGDPETDVASLRKIPNIHLLGGRDYGELPAYLKGFDVALLPNRLNDYTNAMFPMKFFEYLAAGKPVVSVDLPALRDYSEVFTVADEPEAFISATKRYILEDDHTAVEKRQSTARQNTYARRTESMVHLIMSSNAKQM